VTQDSRAVRPGDLYVARAGARTHGVEHTGAALAAGAAAGMTEAAAGPRAVAAGAPAVLEVPDPRAAAGPVAAAVYGDPSRALRVLGVTGTNGKTTTTYLLDAGLRAAGERTGLVGTVETRVGAEVLPSVRTTPEAPDLQALLASMRERGATSVAMEVSSHALALDRVTGTRFRVAGFTNLSQDHLDFHADMDDYFRAKARLFTPEFSDRGVVWCGDAWGRRLVAEATVPVRAVGPAPAEWSVGVVRSDAGGGVAAVSAPDGQRYEVVTALPGSFNVANAVLAFVMLVDAGVDPAGAATGIASLRHVPGRMEPVDAGQPFLVVVDYAHTPDAVETVLREARRLAGDGRVLVVLGCGGDRDRDKRPLMGAAAARLADVAVLTDDNPRSEDPQEILAAVVAGARAAGGEAELRVEPDRRAAVASAVRAARPGDVVVVAGKGHEQGQERAGVVEPFDDRTVAREALADAGYAGRPS
jgi:UDP-N-acetylmuramoyl-L-alanyl-D-glutamate--2,6-diaminopimelate ligase